MKALAPALLLMAGFGFLSPPPGLQAQTLPPASRRPARPDSFPTPQTSPGTARRTPVFPLPFSRGHSPKSRFSAPAIDPHMIVRPPAAAFAQQPPRAPLPEAQKLYPNLRLLPVQDQAGIEPVPIDFPLVKIEEIPTTWQCARIAPVARPHPPQ